MNTVFTPECFFCREASLVILSDTEIKAIKSGALIQDALPSRDADFRELVKTGIHLKCWNEKVGSGE